MRKKKQKEELRLDLSRGDSAFWAKFSEDFFGLVHSPLCQHFRPLNRHSIYYGDSKLNVGFQTCSYRNTCVARVSGIGYQFLQAFVCW